jgi:hypoxanthine phosphoribosyltransferase
LSQCNPLLLCVMNGGIILTGRLATRLKFPLQMDYIHATRYREALQGADLQWRVTPATSIADRTVLVLDDIFDEGETLAGIKDWCEARGAQKVYTAVLVDKQHQRKSTRLKQADFTALYAEDKYLFGYGMDYKGYWRNAPGIYAVGT